MKQQRELGGIRFLVVDIASIVLTALFAVLLLFTTQGLAAESQALQDANDRYTACELAANDLLDLSSYLTTQSRLFSATYHTAYLDNYFWAASDADRAADDVKVLQEAFPGSDAAEHLEMALEFSEKLSKNELYSMKLAVEALDLKVDDAIAAQLDSIPFVRGDELLSNDEMLEESHMLVTYEPYEHDVDRVSKQVEQCKDDLADMLAEQKQQHADALSDLYFRQQVLTILLLAITLFTAIVFIVTMNRPLREYIDRIAQNKRLEEKGAYELRFLAYAYNAMYEQNRLARERLTFQAEHDSLTSLYNRGAFERIIGERRQSPMALVIIDVDRFKEVNDQYGHNCGDLVLKEVASSLTEYFHPEGTPFRLGGDEFVVLLFGEKDELREIIEQRVRKIADRLAVAHDGLPPIDISAGAAFGDGTQVSGELYKYADQALYRVKGEGRRGIAFADEEGVRPFTHPSAPAK